MSADILGIHHVTAIAGDPWRNIDFYVGVLGLRLVKKTVNFDDPFTYHLYFGDEVGNPGTLLTFFPWSSRATRGSRGVGQLTVFSFSIPYEATGFWKERLHKHNVDLQPSFVRFDEEVLLFNDHDGFMIELIGTTSDPRSGWEGGPVPSEFAIRGFHSVTLSELVVDQTAAFLSETLGFQLIAEKGDRFRFEANAGGAGTYVDLHYQQNSQPGVMGVGTVHHMAWRTADENGQQKLRNRLLGRGNHVTPVVDRRYFKSIYFYEPGNVLFEIATDSPGFGIDENTNELGTRLMLPPWLEVHRSMIEQHLPTVTVPRLTV